MLASHVPVSPSRGATIVGPIVALLHLLRDSGERSSVRVRHSFTPYEDGIR